MSLNAVFSLLKSRNIALLEEEGELVIRAPQGAMDEDLLARLKLHKQGLLTALRNGRDVSITPQMLTLVELSQEEIDAIVANVDGGAANIQDIYPLAPLQEGILFHHLLESQGDPYVTRTQIVFENRRYLDHFLAALQTVIERHDILRSAMHWQGLRQPVQVVQRRAKLPVHDLYGGDAEARLSATTDPRQCRMNLQQAPLLQVYIAAEQDGLGWRLVLLNHHLIDDNYTLQLVLSEIRLLLAGRGDELRAPLPYRNFIARMRRTSQAEHEAYFREQLSDVYETTAPFGLLNVQGDGGKVEEATLRLDTELSRRIRDTARSCSVSPAGLLHAAWAVVMGRCSGRDDVVFGTVLSGRLHGGAGAERAVGMFINTLPIRVPLGRHACREVVALTHRRLNSLLAHEQASLATAQRCSAVPSGTPLFTTLINYRHAAIVEADDKALMAWEGARVLFSEERSNYPLTLAVDDFGDDFALTVQAAPGIDPLRIADYMRTVAEGLDDALRHDPDKAVAEIAMLSAAEKRRLLFDWNATEVDYPESSCLQALFEAQVERTPNAVALSFEDNSLTYAELNAKANRLAHYLIEHGVGPDVLVGICIERSLEMVIGLLGVLKAGGAYVPIDPHYPEERLRYMLDDAGVSLLLTRSGLAELTDFDRQRSFYLDADWLQAAFYPAHNPAVRNRSQDLAYIIYTSGSTGQPKGVAVAHGNALHSTQARFAYYADPVRAYLLLSSFAFDSSVAGIFWTLGQGGCLCLPSEEAGKDPAALAALIERQRVSHLLALPSLYTLLLEQASEKLKSLKAAIVAGEACATEVVKRHFAILPVVKLYNEYGPTEGTVWSSVYQAGSDDLDRTLAIGRPVANVRLYILGKSLNPLPVGVAGELYIGGAGIVRGYLNRPELTAERFIPDPFQAGGGRLYKTGDLARYRADGAIEFLGRIDHQVKIRGFRIELGEIEAELLKQPAVKEVVVVAREEQPGDKRLVAYLVEDQHGALVIDELKVQLKQALPNYMVPSAFVVLDEMPLSANGKLDRKKLPAPDIGEQLKKPYVAPRTETETLLAEIWREVLGVEKVGVEDDFFELGGHSLLATQLASRVAKCFSIDLPLRSVFEAGNVATLAEIIDDEKRAHPGVAMNEDKFTIAAAMRSAPIPLSFAQQRLWFLDQLEPDSPLYNIPVALRLSGRLDLAALRQSFSEIVRRHEVLRTIFETGEDGEPVQKILPSLTLEIDSVDLTSTDRPCVWQALCRDEAAKPFDLRRGPLIRAGLLMLDDSGDSQDAILMLTVHHIVSDGWSSAVLVKEFAALYRAFARHQASPLAELPIQYADFACWQRHWLSGEELDRQIGYWRERLQGASGVLELPTDRPRPALKTYRGAHFGFEIPPALALQARAVSNRYNVSLFMLLLSVFKLLLSRHSGQTDLCVGTPFANRNRQEIEDLIGFFVNTLVLRSDLSANPPFAELLEQIRATVLDAQNHQDLPFEKLVEALQPTRDPSRSPLFQVMFVLQNRDNLTLSLPDVEVAVLEDDSRTAKFDLTLHIQDWPDGRLGGSFEYNNDLFDAETMARLARHYLILLQAALECPQTRIFELPLLTDGEKRQLLQEWNATEVEYPQGRCIHQLFEAQVEKTPDAVALSFEDSSLTYAELNVKANQLAHALIDRGVGPDVLVGICIERSLEMVIGLLGILKAGGAYVPLDPHYPEERLRYMLDDAGVSLLLTRQGLTEMLAGNNRGVGYAPRALAEPGVGAGPVRGAYPTDDVGRRPRPLPAGEGRGEGALKTLCLDSDWPAIAPCPEHNPEPCNHPLDLAYIIYTSGSTGQPKGVAVAHGNALHSTQARFAYYADPVRAYLLLSSFAFDSSVAGIFWTLGQGGCLCLPKDEAGKDPVALADLIERHGVSHLLALPSLYTLLLEQASEKLDSLKAAIVAGEACATEVVKRHFAALPAVKLYNEYGPTEATVWSSVYQASLDDLDRPLAIGRPIGNVRLYILDSYLNPAPVGVAGELYIGGAGIVRGYLNRPALSAERFIPDPFQAGGGRLYKTGDLARYRADGAIEFLGRIDHQVKIRGFRIELGEIEARLLQHPDVKEAAVLAREDQPGDKRLVAYLVEDQLGTLVIDELKVQLKQTLPDYMVPSAFVVLDEMPLSANGKLDRKKLPAPDIGEQLRKPYVAPRTETETLLAEIWREVLGVEKVGVEDDFFELGGHSLLATQLAFAVQNRLRLPFPVKAVLEKPTVAEQAGWLSGEADEESLDLQVEAGLGSDILPLPAKPAELGQSRALLLTGATGFLGAFLLADLLEQTQAHVYCLIRAADEAQAFSRLEKQLARYDLLERIDWRRVIPVCGDLASECLGLSEDRYREIAAGVDAIFHNGALVNFVQPYRALKAANVSGSVEVLRLAATERPKAIHYVSTLSVFAGNPSNPQGFTETDEPRLSDALVGGYAQSKWVAEAILRKASLRGFQVAVYRPATVAGDSRNGVWNTDDFLCRVFKGCIQMGLAPEVDSRLDMAPVDFVSGAIVALAQETDVAGGVFHLNHPYPPTANAWFDWFIAAGFPLRKVSTRQWRAAMLAAAETIADFALAPLLTLFAEEAEPDGAADSDEAAGYDCSATQRRLAARGMAYQPIEDTLLARYRDYFVRSGWIDAGKIEKNGE
ncbi:non-ribosomal peptide synthetase [Methylomonas sp. MS20]|uniref:non-ribosomal peptide synthetase n=1 Tax=unclassified Methylomonas TaxID=2608980 RepID=UPI0028A5779E|nr:non-ribosomal peptide synthetase [Methylomonas sp. MV1]MDT4329580.1 amino acid adenylation domain-containing protein [Methylomonas sp. MV1]